MVSPLRNVAAILPVRYGETLAFRIASRVQAKKSFLSLGETHHLARDLSVHWRLNFQLAQKRNEVK
jgi:hypothetical protein